MCKELYEESGKQIPHACLQCTVCGELKLVMSWSGVQEIFT